MNNLKKRLKKITKEYVDIFCKKHDLYLDYIIASDVLGIYCLSNEWFVNFSDMVYSVDNNIETDIFFKWYEDTVSQALSDKETINFQSYSKGLRYEK